MRPHEEIKRKVMAEWVCKADADFDLAEHLDLVETVQPGLAESLRDVIVLTPYGVEVRYPGDRPDATPEIARRAVELARQVRDAVGSIVK